MSKTDEQRRAFTGTAKALWNHPHLAGMGTWGIYPYLEIGAWEGPGEQCWADPPVRHAEGKASGTLPSAEKAAGVTCAPLVGHLTDDDMVTPTEIPRPSGAERQRPGQAVRETGSECTLTRLQNRSGKHESLDRRGPQCSP